GFIGVVLATRVARQYVGARWAALAAISVWWASSLPVYMYFNPSWSHAHSAFTVALFLWYWHETRQGRSTLQWILLGAIAGLMLNVYYANFMVLVVLLVEAAGQYPATLRDPSTSKKQLQALLAGYALFTIAAIVCFLPTLITRCIVYG